MRRPIRTPRTVDSRRKYKLPGGYVTDTPLFVHQPIGIVRAVNQPEGFGIHDEPGLGKAIQGLYTARVLINQGVAESAIILCPSYLGPTWEEQIRTHLPGATYCSFIRKPPKKREWVPGCDFYIINYELLSRSRVVLRRKGGKKMWHFTGHDGVRMAAFLRKVRCVLLADESHHIRIPTSNVTKVACALAHGAVRRYTLTATMLAERVEDSWSQFYFMDKGQALGMSYDEFEERYCRIRNIRMPHGVFPKVVGYKNMAEWHERTKHLCIRRTKADCPDLPDKIHSPIQLNAYGPQLALLRSIRDELVEALKALKSNSLTMGSRGAGGNVTKLIHRLNRAAAMPETVDPSITSSVKLDALVESLSDNPGPRIVWTYHTNVAKAVCQSLGEEAILVIGGLPDRDERLESWKRGKAPYLVATIDALREGVTLNRACLATYLQLDVKRLSWVQSQDRIHRIGQDRTVVIDTYFLRESLDAFIMQGIELKESHITNADKGCESHMKRDSLIQYLQSW